MSAKPKFPAGANAPAVSSRANRPSDRSWMQPFLAALAQTSNVARAARIAGISTATAYEARRKYRDFHRKWQEALCEGYDLLELELLGRLREGEVKPAANARRGVRSYENAVALRLLAAHRENAERQHAVQANVSAAEIRASINRKIAAVKARIDARAAKEATHEPANDIG